jgi:hypothetical protein
LNFRQHLPVHDETMVLVDEINNEFHLLYSYKNHRTDGCNCRINQWKVFAAEHELAMVTAWCFRLPANRDQKVKVRFNLFSAHDFGFFKIFFPKGGKAPGKLRF